MDNKRISLYLQKGQTLITLLFFTVIAVTITSAAIIIIFVNNLASDKLVQGSRAYYIAESGIENALLRFLRNPSYTGETNLMVGEGTADILITGTGPYIITSVGSIGTYKRTIEVTADYTNNILTVISWREI